MKMSKCRSVDRKVVNTTNDSMTVSLDAFVTLLVKVFGLHLPTATKPKHLKNPDVLSVRIEEMCVDLIHHICRDDIEHNKQVKSLLSFLNMLALMFNKFITCDDSKRLFLYKEFERDVLIKTLHNGLCLIKSKKEVTDGGFLDCLCLTLSSDYIKNAKSNTINWLKEQKNKISHGKGSLFKRKLTQYKPEKDIERLDNINEICEFIENERMAFKSKGYEDFPETNKFKSFWYASVAAQKLQKYIELTPTENDYFTHLANKCFSLFKEYVHISNSENPCFVDFLTEFEDTFSEMSLTLSKTYSDKSSLLSAANSFNKLIDLIQKNKATEAFHLSESIVKNNITFINGYTLDLVNKFYICLFIKNHPDKKITPHQFSSIAKNSMLLGSYAFSFPKQDSDAFNKVKSGIFSCSESLYILSAIQTFAEAIDESEYLSDIEKNDCMIPIPEKIESFLKNLYSFPGFAGISETPLSVLSKCTKEIIRKTDEKNYISYILESNLYNCLAEINTLISFWPDCLIDKNQYIKKFCNESVSNKRKLLLAINPGNYKKDAEANATETIEIELNLNNENPIKTVIHLNLNLDFDYFLLRNLDLSDQLIKYQIKPYIEGSHS